MDNFLVKEVLTPINFIPQCGGSKNTVHNFPDENISRKRVRRRPHNKKKNPHKDEVTEKLILKNTVVTYTYDCSLLLEHLTIKPILTNNTSKFIRARNTRHKRIKIYSFVTNVIPVVFSSVLYAQQQCSVTVSTITKTIEQLHIIKQRCTQENNHVVKQNSIATVIRNATAKLKRNKTAAVNKKSNTEKKKTKNKKSLIERKGNTFKECMKKEEVDAGLENGTLIQGVIRINPKDSKKAYVSNKDRLLQDYLVDSVEDRNGALEGDEVVLQLKETKDGKQTAVVVCISKMVHSRITVGFLKLMPDKNKSFAIIYPRDMRLPLIRVPAICWPEDFYKNPTKYENTLFLTKITEWKNVKFAMGMILEQIGLSGDLQSETQAILLEHNLDTRPFSRYVEADLNFEPISPEEYKYREDISNKCVFTIDPASAKDLDDAVSCEELPNGNFKVGVHIADVAFHLNENTQLDNIVRKKATTIYLVNNTYHMLPLELCLQCSLLPGEKKRSFSVFWELTEDGEIVSSYCTRTVMVSCAKLAYEHAQVMIEDGTIAEEDMPEIHCGYTINNLKKVVKQLNTIAGNLRRKRFENGALRLDQPKLTFSLNAEDGEPESWKIYEIKDAHRMIEEFMLLANMSVAERLKEWFPDQAFLRHHEPPVQLMLDEAKASLETYGIFIDISSSGGLQSTLWKYCGDDYLGQARTMVLNRIFAKPMKRANYFCATPDLSEEDYWHYALSIPLYTHFTSPIRRYADIMVHRLLAAGLGYAERPTWTTEMVSAVANRCNTKKYDAKRAGDASMDLFLAHYVERNQPFLQEAVVADVREKMFEVIVMATGSLVRMFPADFDEKIKWEVKSLDNKKEADPQTSAKNKTDKVERKTWKIEVTFPKNNLQDEVKVVIERFTIIKVSLTRKEKMNMLEARLVRPLPTLTFERNTLVALSSDSESDE